VKSIPEALYEACRDTLIFDTHEHMLPRARLSSESVKLTDILEHSYVSWTLPQGIPHSPEAALDALQSVRTRAFYRHWLRAMQILYGFDGDLDAHKWGEISAQVTANYETPDWCRRVFTDHARVSSAILDQYWDHLGDDFDAEVFTPCLRINPLVFGFHPESCDHNGASAHELARREGIRINDFDEYEGFVSTLIRSRKAKGIACLKSALAYDRDLSFASPSRDEAAKIWGRHPDDTTPRDQHVFGDYILNRIADIAGEEGLVFQWHTGLGKLSGSHPHNLIGLVERHPDTTFVLLHGGYPWCREWLSMPFNYINVHLDLTWLPNISPAIAVHTIEAAIDATNPNVLCGGGGDASTAEEAFGALEALRDVVEEALANLIRKDRLNESDACHLAHCILHDNAAALYAPIS
jgi:uncharacterized protein